MAIVPLECNVSAKGRTLDTPSKEIAEAQLQAKLDLLKKKLEELKALKE